MSLRHMRDKLRRMSAAKSERLRHEWLKMRLSSDRRADFYDLLGHFVNDGLPLFEALSAIDQQYRRTREPMGQVTTKLLLRMRGEGGRAHTFGSALSSFVPVIEALAVGSGEDAGDLAEGLRRAASVCRSNGRIGQTIREELAYPLFLSLMFAALMTGIAAYVVPMLSAVLPVERWPLSARWMAHFASAVPWLLVCGGMAFMGLLSVFVATRSSWAGRGRALLDRRVFPWTLHRRVTGALLLTAIATLLRIGVPFSRSLERLGELSGTWEARHLERMRNRLRRGEREGGALSTDLFDESMRWQIELYGRMTRFSDGLDKLAARSIEQTQAAIRKSFAALRVILMIGIAAMVAWVYMAFLSITMNARTLT